MILRSLLILLALLSLSGTSTSSSPSRSSSIPVTHTVKLNGHSFTLPKGFTIELVAGADLVPRPVSATFDAAGVLYVTDASGTNDPPTKQLKDLPHRVIRLVDQDNDGVFDRANIFANKLMLPQGAMWHDGSLFVGTPPSIWKLTDTTGKGVADRREEWFAGKTLTGCANDLHGPYAGPDGWIYWTKGAFAEQSYKRHDGSTWKTTAAHIFRSRADGSQLEPIMTGGMDNPVGVSFSATGERFFTTTFVQHPAGGKRDAIVHAVYGGVWGKEHGVITGHPRTAPQLMPVMTHLGPAAPAGLCRYESSIFGPEYRDNLFVTQFNTAKVSRHVLSKQGASYVTKDEDFVVSDNRDFHPTDVLEDADGSLLILDTGGWYKLCCPTSQIGKPDVTGAIYRVRRKDAKPVIDPRGTKILWSKQTPTQLAALLDDDRSAVVRRAVELLAKSGEAALEALSKSGSQHRLWAAMRIDHPTARALIREALKSADEDTRQIALHGVSLLRDAKALDNLLKLLKGPSLHNRRAAAEALGRLGDAKAVPGLLEAAGESDDFVLSHALIYALVEINHREATIQGLSNDSPKIQRAALLALAAMPTGELRAKEVIAKLSAKDPALVEAAWWIVGQRPSWAKDLVPFFREKLTAAADDLPETLGRFTAQKEIQDLLSERLRDSTSSQERLLILRVMAQTRLKNPPKQWADTLANLIPKIASEKKEGTLLLQLLRTARSFSIAASNLEPIIADKTQSAEVRLTAATALPANRELPPTTFALLRERLPLEPTLALEALSRAKLSDEQLRSLSDSVKPLGPMDIGRAVGLYARSTNEATGKAFVETLLKANSRFSLHPDMIKTTLAKYPPSVAKAAEPLYAELDKEAGQRKAHLEKVLAEMKPGDVRRGQTIFNSTKAACASCHAIGYLGGKIGPDLTRIGTIRNQRDLVEAILYPSASFVRSYEPVNVVLESGKIYNGNIKSENAEEIELIVSATEEVRIGRKTIESLTPSKVSVMPAGLEKVLTTQELSDLVEFLLKCR